MACSRKTRLRPLRIEQIDLELGPRKRDGNPRRAAARTDVHHWPFGDQLGGGERVVHVHAPRLLRVTDRRQPRHGEKRLEPALEPRVAGDHS